VSGEEDGSNVPMKQVPTASENFSTFIGISKYDAVDMQGQGNRAAMQDPLGGMGDEYGDGNQLQHDSFDSQIDEIDEERYLRAYWRAEEGQGL